MKSVLGLDVGGTTIKGGVLDPSTGEILARGARQYDQDVPAEKIHARAADLVVELEETARTYVHRDIGAGQQPSWSTSASGSPRLWPPVCTAALCTA